MAELKRDKDLDDIKAVIKEQLEGHKVSIYLYPDDDTAKEELDKLAEAILTSLITIS